MGPCKEPFACARHQLPPGKPSPAGGGGVADPSDSRLRLRVRKESWEERFPPVLRDVLAYGALKPQAWVLRLGNMWLREDGSHVGWGRGGEFSIS